MKKILLCAALIICAKLSAQSPQTFRGLGEDLLTVIERAFVYPTNRYVYSEFIGSHPAYAWSSGIQLKALTYAGYNNSTRKNRAISFFRAFDEHYLCTLNGYEAYNASYGSNGDRYYDDNAWIAKDLMELYNLTNDQLYINKAKMLLKFILETGKCPSGGIRFHEKQSVPGHEDYDTYAVFATAPTAITCLKVYEITAEQYYFDEGKTLYEDTKKRGWKIGPGARGYENAVVMQTAIMLYKITGKEQYLHDAQNIGYAMETHYIDWESHRLNEAAKWGGHDMTDAYVNMYEVDPDPDWLNIAAGYLTFLQENCPDSDGLYPIGWNDVSKTSERNDLLSQASAASAFTKMSLSPGGATKEYEPVAVFKEQRYNDYGTKGSSWSTGLHLGKYTQEDLAFKGITNPRFLFEPQIASIKISEGYKVTLYNGPKFQGNSTVITESRETMPSGWNKTTRSLIIESTSNVATLYIDKDFSGESFSLPEGKYSIKQLNQIGIADNSISSIKVDAGFEVLVFDEHYWEGAPQTYSNNVADLGEMNEKVSSVIVRRYSNSSIKAPEGVSITIYPLPAKEILHLGNLPNNSRLEISNIAGTLVLSKTTFESNVSLNVSSLPKGMYLLHIYANGQREVKKILLE
jgi:predicted small secreted protein